MRLKWVKMPKNMRLILPLITLKVRFTTLQYAKYAIAILVSLRRFYELVE